MALCVFSAPLCHEHAQTCTAQGECWHSTLPASHGMQAHLHVTARPAGPAPSEMAPGRAAPPRPCQHAAGCWRLGPRAPQAKALPCLPGHALVSRPRRCTASVHLEAMCSAPGIHPQSAAAGMHKQRKHHLQHHGVATPCTHHLPPETTTCPRASEADTCPHLSSRCAPSSVGPEPRPPCCM